MTRYAFRQETTLGRRQSNIPCLACAFSAAATTGGTVYAFGMFANDLKRNLHLSQIQLGAISATFFIAGIIGFLPGLIVDRMRMRFSMATGGICGATFTMIYWIICRMPDLFPLSYPVTVLGFLAVAISLSCGLIIGSVFKLTLSCGGREGKGPAVGIAKGFTGLGSGIYATIFQALRNNDETTLDFLPVIAFSFIICAAIPALFLLPTKEQAHPHLLKIETTPLHFRTMYAALLALYLLIIISAVHDMWGAKAWESLGRQYGKVAVILFLWLGPIISLFFLPRKEDQEKDMPISSLTPISSTFTGISVENDIGSEESTDFDEEERKEILSSWKADEEEEQFYCDGSYQNSSPLPPTFSHKIIINFRPELSLPEMLQTRAAWLMLWTCLILVGSGTATTNNLGQMVEALGFSDNVTPATLAIFSVAQSASRTTTGIVSEAALKWNIHPSLSFGGDIDRVPRPFFLAIASCIALFAHLLLTLSTSLTFFVIGCAISAIAFGMTWPLMVQIVGDVFGFEHHGANYMFFDGATKALGTLFLSTYVAGSVYEAHVDEELGDGLTCLGNKCFQGMHMVISGLAITCIIASFLLCHTTREAYIR